jgi:hypothetical protein
MKKLLFMMFLMLGTLSFASSGEIVKNLALQNLTFPQGKTANIENTAVWCCTIGGFRCCGPAGTDQCSLALSECYRWRVCGQGGGGCGCIGNGGSSGPIIN